MWLVREGDKMRKPFIRKMKKIGDIKMGLEKAGREDGLRIGSNNGLWYWRCWISGSANTLHTKAKLLASRRPAETYCSASRSSHLTPGENDLGQGGDGPQRKQKNLTTTRNRTRDVLLTASRSYISGICVCGGGGGERCVFGPRRNSSASLEGDTAENIHRCARVGLKQISSLPKVSLFNTSSPYYKFHSTHTLSKGLSCFKLHITGERRLKT
jgi:hypothetical protein